MPLHVNVEKMLKAAGDTYLKAHPSSTNFAALENLIRSSPGLTQLLNDAYAAGALVAFDYRTNTTSGRSGYDSLRFKLVGSGSLKELKEYKKGQSTVVAKGTILFADDIINFAAGLNATGTQPEATGPATAAFIVAHEAGHAMNAIKFAEESVASINRGLNFIASEQAKIDALPPSERIGKVINVQAALQDYLTVAMREEGRASIYAYNAWVDSMKAQGKTVDDKSRSEAFGRYKKFLAEESGALITGLEVDPVTGHIRMVDGNVELLGQRNAQQQTGAITHNVTYMGEALAYFAAHRSGAVLEFDAAKLGFTNGAMTIEQSLARIRGNFWKGEAKLRDTASGREFLVVSKKHGSAAVVIPLNAPVDGVTEAPQEIYINLTNSDGRRTFDQTSIHLKRTSGDNWLIKVKDSSGKEVTLTPAEFKKIFGMDVQEAFDRATAPGDSKSLLLAPVAISESDGNYIITTLERDDLVPGGVRIAFEEGFAKPVDYQDREVHYIYDGDNITSYFVRENGVTVLTTLDADLDPIATDVRINDNPVGIEFSDAGAVIGQQLGYLIAGGNALTGLVSSAALKTVGDNLGDYLDGLIGNQSVHKASQDAFKNFGPELLNNLKAAGIGAFSSFLMAELINAVGIDGIAGEVLNTAGGTAISTIASNLAGVNGAAGTLNPFYNLGSALPTAVGSFFGNMLANEVYTFKTVGGQIGSAVGSSLGVIAAIALASGPTGWALAAVAAIGAFIGNLVGGMIGSVFGGTPRSGADVEWSDEKGEFVVANVYSRKNGSREAAKSMATAAAEAFNGILDATGGTLLNPKAVQAGNYGMREDRYVYRPRSTRDKDAITKSYEGKDGAEKLIGYGIYKGLSDADFKIAGGNVYVKRALYNSFSNGGLNPNKFDFGVLVGNIAAARRYELYLSSSTAVNALIAAEPHSVFTAEWAVTFAQAVELGLTRRHESDWYGGYTFLLDEAGSNAASVGFGLDYDASSDRVSRVMSVGEFVIGDAIDVAGQTAIDGTSGDDVITLGGGELRAVTAGNAAEKIKVDGVDYDGSIIPIGVAATVDAGDGADIVHASDRGDNVFGGAGNDTLYGGRLDDWLFGGDGNDRLDAGSVTVGALGGDGNYLNGGAGNDALFGREGSDWLEGGDGTDVLAGGGGDDILAGGAGAGDDLKGGEGDDQYLVRVGDGADVA